MKKKSIIIAIIVVALVVIGVIGFIAMSDLMQGITLRNEVDKIGKADMIKDDIDMTIKTKGDYAVVEGTIKEYMNIYSVASKELAKILEDEQIAQVLTAENYKDDGPDFVKTKEYITKTRVAFNEKINLLIDMTSEEKMMEAIEEKGLKENFIDLYKELMLGNEIKTDLQEIVNTLQESNTTINNILDTQEKIINMLIENKGKWQVNNDGEIEFESQKLVDQYNQFISSL